MKRNLSAHSVHLPGGGNFPLHLLLLLLLFLLLLLHRSLSIRLSTWMLLSLCGLYFSPQAYFFFLYFLAIGRRRNGAVAAALIYF